MKFYKAIKGDVYDYLTGYATVKNELVTQRERDTKFRYLSDSVFEEVNVSKKRTFWNFGVRFECEGGK